MSLGKVVTVWKRSFLGVLLRNQKLAEIATNIGIRCKHILTATEYGQICCDCNVHDIGLRFPRYTGIRTIGLDLRMFGNVSTDNFRSDCERRIGIGQDA